VSVTIPNLNLYFVYFSILYRQVAVEHISVLYAFEIPLK